MPLLEDDSKYLSAREAARPYAVGNLWCIGGYVARKLSSLMHGTSTPSAADVDFMSEYLKPGVNAPPGWTVARNSFGNPKLSRGDVLIDICPLSGMLLGTETRPVTLQDFLDTTPFDYQSLAYDVDAMTLSGEAGIAAVRRQEIRVHNRAWAEVYARMKGRSVEELLLEKAGSLGFKAIL